MFRSKLDYYHYFCIEFLTNEIYQTVEDEIIFSDKWYEELYDKLPTIIDDYVSDESIELIRESVNDYGVFKAIIDYQDEDDAFIFDQDEDACHRELAIDILKRYFRDNIEDLIKEHIDGYDYMAYFNDFLNA